MKDAKGNKLRNGEVALHWVASLNIDKVPKSFERLFQKYPEVQLLLFSPHSKQYYNCLVFTFGTNLKTQSTIDTMESNATFGEFEKWLLKHLKGYFQIFLLHSKQDIQKSFETQIKHGDNPYCIIWKGTNIVNIPYILIWMFLKIHDIHIAFFESQTSKLEIWPSKNQDTISLESNFYEQLQWIKNKLNIIANDIENIDKQDS